MAKAVFNLQEASLPGGHFFVDQFPDETSQILLRFLSGAL
jgi:haloacetate dehalogenase